MVTQILHGIGGSQAYGLANANSDEDHVGVHSVMTNEFWALQQPQLSIVRHQPYDFQSHEIGKFLALAAKSNPTVLETLWLDEYVEKEHGWGDALIGLRQAFLSAHYVHNAYLGYAESQFRKLMTRGSSFSSDTKNRTGKHGRHCIRLMEMGLTLYATGTMTLKVADPDYYRRISDMKPEAIQKEFMGWYEKFTDAKTVLPEKPDYGTINAYLQDYRAAHIIHPED